VLDDLPEKRREMIYLDDNDGSILAKLSALANQDLVCLYF
jgi:hypothetical protein